MSLLFECKKEECTRAREKWIGGGGAASNCCCAKWVLCCILGVVFMDFGVTLSGNDSDELP